VERSLRLNGQTITDGLSQWCMYVDLLIYCFLYCLARQREGTLHSHGFSFYRFRLRLADSSGPWSGSYAVDSHVVDRGRENRCLCR
jgi:hypothetical protein